MVYKTMSQPLFPLPPFGRAGVGIHRRVGVGIHRRAGVGIHRSSGVGARVDIVADVRVVIRSGALAYNQCPALVFCWVLPPGREVGGGPLFRFHHLTFNI